MFKVRKIISVFVLFGLVLTGLGCKGVPADLASKTQPITLEYWTVFDDVDAINALAQSYQSNHPFITFKVRQFRQDEIYQQFVDALAEDRGPDIISVQDRAIGQYMTKLAAMPASVRDVTMQVVKGQFGSQTTYNDQAITLPNVNQVSREYVQAVGSVVSRGDKVYGLPLSFDTLALYYNKDLLDRAGIAEPPKTWNDFVEDVKKLSKFDKNNNNKIIQAGTAMGVGSNVPGSDDALYVLFRQSQVPFVNANGRAVFDLPQQMGVTASVVDFYTDFADPSRDRYSWNAGMENAFDSFTHGTLAFFLGYNYHYPLLRQRAPQLNFEVTALPQLHPDNAVNAGNFWLQAVPAKSKHQSEAWAFINYITHSGATKMYLDATERPAALRSLLAGQISSAGATPAGPPSALGVFAAQALTAESWYKGRSYDAAKSAVNDMLKEWLQTPPDPSRAGDWKQGVLNRAAQKINQTL